MNKLSKRGSKSEQDRKKSEKQHTCIDYHNNQNLYCIVISQNKLIHQLTIDCSGWLHWKIMIDFIIQYNAVLTPNIKMNCTKCQQWSMK